jgi:hypothetical protein
MSRVICRGYTRLPTRSGGGVRSVILVVVAAVWLIVLAGGCGSSTAPTTPDAQLRVRQDALVAFFRAFMADRPIHTVGREAALRFTTDLKQNPPNVAGAETAATEAVSTGEAFRRSMEHLPATNAELIAARRLYADAAADDVETVRDYLAVLRSLAAGRPNSELATRAEALTAKSESLFLAGKTKVAGALEKAGGEAFLKSRFNGKQLKEAAESGLSERKR